MAKSRDWKSAGFPGVRYREHLERKHGRQPDRYFSIRYRYQGRNYDEVVGWASEGIKPSDAYRLLGTLKHNQRTGSPPCTLAEMRAMEDASRQAEAEAKAQAEKAGITLAQFFEGDYLKAQEGKKPDSIRREKELFKLFIGPEIGAKTFKDVSPFDVERIKAKMIRMERSGRTIEYWYVFTGYPPAAGHCP